MNNKAEFSGKMSEKICHAHKNPTKMLNLERKGGRADDRVANKRFAAVF